MKAYINHVVRSGVTFRSNPDQTVTGLLTIKRLTVLVTSAGDSDTGSPAHSWDHLTPYMKFIWGIMGVNDVTVVKSGSSWQVDRKMMTLDTYVQGAAPKVVAVVQWMLESIR